MNRVRYRYYCSYCDVISDDLICRWCEHKGNPFPVPKESGQ